MMGHSDYGLDALIALYALGQFIYALGFVVDFYFLSLPVNMVDMKKLDKLRPDQYPYIVLFYPVLRELEATMRTTFISLTKLDYPADKFSVIAIPNDSDTETLKSLNRLSGEFPFLKVLSVPPTSDPSWQVVWDNWDANEKAYWWHRGPRAGVRDLPPKKTRQLIYAFYKSAEMFAARGDYLINYIDADSAPPPDHFLAGAAGMLDFDVLQSKNIAGNLNDSLASSWHAFDHMAWDGKIYQHMSANAAHPFWVLGKGLFFRASDLVTLGGFHPWMTIEDPEVGMRFWKNGKRLGIIENPLIEEVPATFGGGITQRKRWIAGFFQSLSRPLHDMGMSAGQRFRARLNVLPCLTLLANLFGVPTGIWALYEYLEGNRIIPGWLLYVSLFNVVCLAVILAAIYWTTWRRTRIVLKSWWARVWYMVRINPLFLLIWWLIWTIPIFIGFSMFMGEGGLEWQRTEKVDANAELVRTKVRQSDTALK